MTRPTVTETPITRNGDQEVAGLDIVHRCAQCGAVQPGVAWILGPVCGACCRANHRAVTR